MENIESRYYINKDDFVMCNRQGGEWSCMQIQKGQERQTEDVNKNMDELKKNVETHPVTRLPDRVIAGVNCKCFKVTVSINVPQAKETGLSEFESTSCVSPEGIPLYTETRSESMTSIMEATKYSTHVSDADFIPPAEPVDMMEAMMGGSGGQGADEQPMVPAEDMEDAGMSSDDIKQAQCDACEKMPNEDAKEQCMKMFKC